MAITVRNEIPEVDLEVYAGDDFPFTLHWSTQTGTDPVADLDLTGTHSAQVRTKETDTSVAAEIVVDDVRADEGWLTFFLDSENSRMLCMSDEARLVRDPDGTMKMKFVGRWDCQWVNPDGLTRTICKGSVLCWLDVTRPIV